jgi:hypothetical protein
MIFVMVATIEVIVNARVSTRVLRNIGTSSSSSTRC